MKNLDKDNDQNTADGGTAIYDENTRVQQTFKYKIF